MSRSEASSSACSFQTAISALSEGHRPESESTSEGTKYRLELIKAQVKQQRILAKQCSSNFRNLSQAITHALGEQIIDDAQAELLWAVHARG
eukprot:8905496-Karenia_brevis.AAC.1